MRLMSSSLRSAAPVAGAAIPHTSETFPLKSQARRALLSLRMVRKSARGPCSVPVLRAELFCSLRILRSGSVGGAGSLLSAVRMLMTCSHPPKRPVIVLG